MPPRPIKQTPNPLAVPTQVITPESNGHSSILNRIKPVKSKVSNVRMSLYGRPKSGKTRLSCTFPKPLLIIGAEDGTTSVIGSKGIDFVMLQKCEEIGELIQGPIAAGKYASVVIDNGTKFRDMRICEIMGVENKASIRKWKEIGWERWMECSNTIKDMWRPLLDIGRQGVLNIVIIAQEGDLTKKKDDKSASSGTNPGHDLITPHIGPDLGGALAQWINAECDYIGQMLVRSQSVKQIVPSAVEGAPDTEILIPTGKKEYCLRVGPHEVYEAGFRLPDGKILTEDFIIDPSFSKIMEVINGK